MRSMPGIPKYVIAKAVKGIESEFNTFSTRDDRAI